MNILAIDPGGTTGLAMRLNGELVSCVATKPSEVWNFIVPELDEVVYERFASSVATSHFAVYTIELCGSIQGRVATLNEAMRVLGVAERADDFRWLSVDEVTNRLAELSKVVHQLVLVRHEPQNRLAFIKEAKEIVAQLHTSKGQPFGKTMVHEVDAMAHLLAREALGDDIRKRDWGLGLTKHITNA